MASVNEVRQYLAYWFQAGKKVIINGGNDVCQPSPVIQGDRYSQEFEQCWERVSSPSSGDCYLEGTSQTVSELLSEEWDLASCARCGMPVPMISIGVSSLDCPCIDMPTWPNSDLPSPRSPVNSDQHLNRIRDRLKQGDRLNMREA